MTKKMSRSEVLIVLAAIVILLSAIKFAVAIVVPLLLATFIAVIISPLYGWLLDKKVPTFLALISVIISLVLTFSILGLLVGSSVQSFSENLPAYESRLHDQVAHYIPRLKQLGISATELTNMFDPASVMRYSASVLKGAGSVLTNSFMILLIIIFMLLESCSFVKKLRQLSGQTETMKHLHEVLTKVQHYMALKALVSLVTGIIITIALSFIGLDYALLWGVVAFSLNFIPNIGSIIAAIPAVLLAFIQLGMFGALEVGLVFLSINIIIGSIIEPRLMGQGLGLSTLVVFLSLIFWGWLLGPVGMLLSIPLTIMIKILLYSDPSTRSIAILMDSSSSAEESPKAY